MKKNKKRHRSPCVSVILTVYNMQTYLRECLDSIVNQSLKDIEIICVDDGSTDSSLQILKEYQAKDDRFIIIEQENRGAGAARNAGLAAAKGEYLSILDSDDFFDHEMLEKAYNAAKEQKADIVVFQADFFNHELKRFEPCGYSLRLDRIPDHNPFSADDISDRIFNIGCGWAWDKLFKRSFVENCNIRFQEIRTTNDMLFVFYLYSRARSIYVLKQVLAHQRIHAYCSLSVTREKSWDNFYLALSALKKRLSEDGTYEKYRHSFVNWALNFTLWNIDTLGRNERKQLISKCRLEYFHALDVSGNTETYFIEKKEFERLEEYMNEGNNLKVSVIIPVYNGERYLRQCLDSVCAQSLREIQIICVNDGSTDTTADILKEYADKDDRILIINKEHTNAGESRNAGLEFAEGKYLSFLDADDFFEPNMLQEAYDAAEQDSADICAFRCNMYDENNGAFVDCPWTLKLEEMPENRPFSNHDCAEKIFTMTSSTAWDKLFNREFVLRNQIRFQNVESCNDMLFTFSALSVAERITTFDQILAHHRINQIRTLAKDIEYLWHNFYDSLMALKQFLMDTNIYTSFKKSFENWAIDFSLWNMHNYKEVFRDQIHQALKRHMFDDLGLSTAEREDFFNQDLYNKMEAILDERVIVPEGERPKVSIIIPTYNVEPYLRICLDSAIYQTLENIEIIVVNDGSTDNCLEIIQEYAARDKRIIVIDKENGGYGKAMNCGLDRATGEYIGIIEPDDFVELHMFEDLYHIAKANELDFVKADFNRFTHDEYGNIILMFNGIAKKPENYNKIIKPSDNQESFAFVMNTWSGIYNREFLEKHGIRHHETPGASFQDNGFWFLTMMYAERAMFFDKPYYFNRRDNPNSSVASREKVYCMNQEYKYIRELLLKEPEMAGILLGQLHWKKYHNYLFRYNVIAEEYQEEYIRTMADEFKEAIANGEFDSSLFQPFELENIRWMIEDPHDYFLNNNANTPSVSVIIPVYNTSEHLRQCLDSVLNQTMQKIEVICVDDGSDDDSIDILREYEAADPRVIVLQQKNAGGGAARNKGLAIAKGKYLSFLDSDDFFEPKMLEEAFKKSERFGADICIYKVRRFNNITGEYTSDKGSFVEAFFPSKSSGIEVFSSKDLGSHVFNTFQTWPWNKMFNRRFVMKNNLKFQEILRTNDMYFVDSALLYAERITVVRIELVNYRIGTTSNCQATNNMAPTDFHKALTALYSEVIKKSNPEALISFYNLYVRSCNYNLQSVFSKDAEAYAYLYRYLHGEGFDMLDPTTIDEKCITSDNKKAYKECCQVRKRTFESYMVDKLTYNRSLVHSLEEKIKKTEADNRDTINAMNKKIKAIKESQQRNEKEIEKLRIIQRDFEQLKADIRHIVTICK